ncbi:MAG: histidine phosphatase family protein [Robiginitomaculum sp.]|nr:histidine phosphatase family protein [Robiginitomaculum sp.]
MVSYSEKRLFLLRHAIAVNEISDGDISRALAPKGKEDARALGQYMLDNSYVPDLVLCSPARRTRETLEGLQNHLEINNINKPDILYSGSTGDYLHEIQQCEDSHQNILIIAHNPSIYELLILLAAQGDDSMMQRLSEGYAPATLSIINCICEKWADIQPAENELYALVNPMDYNAPARPTRWM